jgi:succinate dehydrogenase / fumarate reductase, cytochrome b subunit
MATPLFKSSLVRKYWMALTGLFLITFLIVHAAINAMIFFNDGGKMFNEWAHFMSKNVIVRSMEIVLFLGLLVHVVDGLMIYFQNRRARPVRYAFEKSSASSRWYSRSMALLGTLILIFLVVHLAHFWVKTRITELTAAESVMMIDGHLYENLYAEMLLVFQSPLVVVIYVLGCISLFWHLLHGFRSAFQSLGLGHHKYRQLIATTGDAFSVIISALFASMPIAMYFGLVQ